jgi:putative membrane protein
VSARFLDEPAFAKAIQAIEDASSLEVVVALRRTSAGYHHANAIIGLLAAFAGLATMLFVEHEFSHASILIDPFVVGSLAALLIELAPGLKRALTPPAIRDREVRKAARAVFIERGVHNTRDRSGLLLYISWLEQRAVVITDSGVDAILPPEALRTLEQALTAAIPRGGAAVADQLSRSILTLAPGMPRRPDDRNELPDTVDSNLRGKR